MRIIPTTVAPVVAWEAPVAAPARLVVQYLALVQVFLVVSPIWSFAELVGQWPALALAGVFGLGAAPLARPLVVAVAPDLGNPAQLILQCGANQFALALPASDRITLEALSMQFPALAAQLAPSEELAAQLAPDVDWAWALDVVRIITAGRISRRAA